MSYAVSDFYQNGGKQAVIVRLVDDSAQSATANPDGGLVLRAVSAGTWGNNLSYLCDNIAVNGDKAVLFNLNVYELVGPDKTPVLREIIRNVSCKNDSPRRIDLVLKVESEFVRAETPTKETQPTVIEETPFDLTTLFKLDKQKEKIPER